MRLLVWLAFGLLVYFAWCTHVKRNRTNNKFGRVDVGSDKIRSTTQSGVQVEKMVACAYCQMYLPMSEAMRSADLPVAEPSEVFFCSKEHAKLYSDAAKNSP